MRDAHVTHTVTRALRTARFFRLRNYQFSKIIRRCNSSCKSISCNRSANCSRDNNTVAPASRANLRIAIETAEIWATESEFSEASETDCSTVNNALYWLEVFIYFDSEEDAKEASPTRCPIERIRSVAHDCCLTIG